MADPPPYPESNDDIGVGPDRGSTDVYPGTPRWVKVFGIIALALVLLFVIMLLTDPGRHGPGRHTRSSGPGGYTPPIEHGVQQP